MTRRPLSVTLTAAMVLAMGSMSWADETTDQQYTTDGNTVYAGSVTTQEGEEGAGELNYNLYKGEEGKDYTDEKVYTYNDYIAGTTNMKWGTVNWETADDSYVVSKITSGFYTFYLNDTKDGWAIGCDLASELPVDVTSEYVGSYGIEEGDTAKAWKITLNPDACWEDGTPINADSYIYSYQQLLDPIMLNRRADSLYAGDFQIYGAKNYVYQGKTSFNALGETVEDYLANGGDESQLYVDVTSFWNVTAEDGSQYVSITDETPIRDEAVEDENADEAYVSGKYLYETYLAPGCDYADNAADYVGTMQAYEADYSFDNVGIFKTGDYEIVFVTTSPVASPDYYVPYNLSSTYLVYEDLWESCKTYFNSNGDQVDADSDDIASITTNYGTSAETTMSFGPYRLDYFELDKQITFTRNDNWFGYKDGKHTGMYQADNISCQVIAEQSTALLAFLNGEIDNVSLVASDMSTYGSSDYIRYTPQSYTTKLTFNTDLAKTTERGTQILTNLNFRKAFSYAIDRNTFAAAYTSAGSAGFGMLNNLYVYDPYTGATYRDSDGAKEALCNLYGMTWGEDGDYEDLDEAYEAITGYDISYAQSVMQQAYDECVADGLYDGESSVEIELRVYQSDDVYVQMFNYLNSCLEAACEGTGFEGKVSMKMVVDADYYETNYSGGADMIFTTWGGATYSPWTVLYECYCDASDGSGQQMEYGFDTSAINVVIDVDGATFTQPLQTWALWADGDINTVLTSDDGSVTLDAFADYSYDTEAEIFGKLEYAFLSYYTTTPLYYRNSGSLVSQKGDFAVTQYIDLVEFGGIEYYTFDYDDTEWEAVKGSLTY
jgi:oligopeptide transport system substrate-binding protein